MFLFKVNYVWHSTMYLWYIQRFFSFKSEWRHLKSAAIPLFCLMLIDFTGAYLTFDRFKVPDVFCIIFYASVCRKYSGRSYVYERHLVPLLLICCIQL